MEHKHHHGIMAVVVVILVILVVAVFMRPEANRNPDENLRTFIDKGLTEEAQIEFDLRINTLKAGIDASEEFNSNDYLILGNLYYQTGELALSRDAYQEILERNPDDIGALENLGVTLELMEDYEGAARAWTRSLSLSGNVRTVIRLVDVIEEHLPQQYDRVDDVLELAIQSLGQDEQLNGRLGAWYFANEDYERAESHWKVAETLAGNSGKYDERIAEAQQLMRESLHN